MKIGGVGRITPRVSYTSGDAYSFGDILLSDWHYISHPVEGNGSGYQLEVDYQLSSFDGHRLPNMRLPRMIRLLKNNSSLISQAGLTFQQFFASGYKLEGNPRATDNIRKILKLLEKRRKPLPILLGQIADGIFYGGGMFTEVVLAKDKMTTIDFVVNDPLTVKFQLYRSEDYGEDFRLVKVDRQGRIFNLDGDDSIQYLPTNSDVNSPFGKPFMLAAIFPSIWQLLLLKDTRDVLRSQIYPFVHVKVDTAAIIEACGGDLKEATIKAERAKTTALEAWNKKGVNTAIGTSSDVEYSIISGMNRANFGMLNPIIDILSSQVASGTGIQPLFMGINTSTTETNADVQWLIEIAIIRSVQQIANNSLTHSFNYMNQAAGVGGEVIFTLLEMNAMERKREADIFIAEEEALTKLIDQLSASYAQGIITMQDMVETYQQRRDRIYQQKQMTGRG